MLGFNILPSYSYLLEKPSEPKKTPIAKLRKIFHLEHFYDGQRTKHTNNCCEWHVNLVEVQAINSSKRKGCCCVSSNQKRSQKE